MQYIYIYISLALLSALSLNPTPYLFSFHLFIYMHSLIFAYILSSIISYPIASTLSYYHHIYLLQIAPLHRTFRVLFSSIDKSRVDTLNKLWKDMTEHFQLKPNTEIYNTVLRFYGITGNRGKAIPISISTFLPFYNISDQESFFSSISERLIILSIYVYT